MNQYITGAIIKKLREERGLTQAELAERLKVSSKAVSKWETGKGYPDITLLEPIAEALSISVFELISGDYIRNMNRSFNYRKVRLYVCPICGNIIAAGGDAVISCCGVTLPALEAEKPDEAHCLKAEIIEDEYYISSSHEMSKTHYISFIAAVSDSGLEIKKLYPEGPCEARFKLSRTERLFYYCSLHGLFETRP